eukprot:1904889-Amphidinium_carterae.1
MPGKLVTSGQSSSRHAGFEQHFGRRNTPAKAALAGPQVMRTTIPLHHTVSKHVPKLHQQFEANGAHFDVFRFRLWTPSQDKYFRDFPMDYNLLSKSNTSTPFPTCWCYNIYACLPFLTMLHKMLVGKCLPSISVGYVIARPWELAWTQQPLLRLSCS